MAVLISIEFVFFRIGVFQSVVDAYVNCEKIGRRITTSVLDLFAYKKRFKPNKVEFRLGQKGFGRVVNSRYHVSRLYGQRKGTKPTKVSS